MSGTWTTLTHEAPFGAGTMLLLTDGDVLVHEEGGSPTRAWWRLSPDLHGSYRHGRWRKAARGLNAPLYFACAVLRDGRVIIAGGEFEGESSDQVEQSTVGLYDPVADRWARVRPPAGWDKIGDAPSAVLPDGRFLVGDIFGRRTAAFDPATDLWTETGPKHDPRATEETWALLPDQSVLALQCDARPRAEKYLPAADAWVSAGQTPVHLVDDASLEIGASILLPDGRVFCIGASQYTALYEPPALSRLPGRWTVGPHFPGPGDGLVTGAKDAPAVLLPNGRVLCIVGTYDPEDSESWGAPLQIFEFDPAPGGPGARGTLTAAPAPPNGEEAPYTSRLMLLPTGEVLHTNGTQTVAMYAPDGGPDPLWRPSITSAPRTIEHGSTFTLAGRQLNGLSQAVIYGDEGAMATNYPIVRLEHSDDGVTYCRTHGHSTMGVNTGAVIHTTHVTVPAHSPRGPARLVVVANGIPSEPVDVVVR